MAPAPLERRVQTVCLLVLTVIGVGAALSWLRPVMIPFVLAVFLALAIAPLVEFQMRFLRLPRPLAVAATLLVALVVLGLLALLVSISLRQLTANAAAYQEQLALLVNRVAASLPLEKLGVRPEQALAPLREIPVGVVGNMLLGTTNAIMNTLSQSFLVLIFLIYLLIGRRSGARADRRGTWVEIQQRVERYIVTKAVISAATGFLVGAALALLGVDLALVFGLFAFLLNFIPSIGSVIATLLPLPVVIVSPEISTPVAVLAIVIPGGIQMTIGNVLEPMIMGDSLDLHPITILMALILWGMVWGIVGMLLATPITAVLKILFEKLELTRPLARLLAGRLGSLGAT